MSHDPDPGNHRDAHPPRLVLSRRGLQLTLAALWFLDGALQLQTFMFSRGFAQQVIAPAADGQPAWVAAPVRYAARVIASHPAGINFAFALAQLALAAAFLIPRLLRAAILASIAWSVGVWYFGEGLAGLASGHATLITGAPGAVLLYAVLAASTWLPAAAKQSGGVPSVRQRLPGWLPAAWAVVWVTGALLQIAPGQNTSAAIRDELSGGDSSPTWTTPLHHAATHLFDTSRPVAVMTLALLLAIIGIGALPPDRTRILAAGTGSVLTLAFWILGQNLGALTSGQATDPNTGPLILVMAIALPGVARPQPGAHRSEPTMGAAPHWAMRRSPVRSSRRLRPATPLRPRPPC